MEKQAVAIMIIELLASAISATAKAFGLSNEELAAEVDKAMAAKMGSDAAWAEYADE